MRTLNPFTTESHPELNKDVYVPAGTFVRFKSWKFDSRAVSGVKVTGFLPDRCIDIEMDAGFLFPSMAPIAIIATLVKFNKMDIVEATKEVDKLIKTRIYSLTFGI